VEPEVGDFVRYLDTIGVLRGDDDLRSLFAHLPGDAVYALAE
jgi:hypothetical protein